MFLNKIRNIFFVSATNVVRVGKRGNIFVGNNESATMCPRLPGPLEKHLRQLSIRVFFSDGHYN